MTPTLKSGLLATTIMCIGGMTAKAAAAQTCTPATFETNSYTVCSVETDKAELRLFWKNGDGQPYRLFSSVAEAVTATGRKLAFAMNAGMYNTDFSPIGLYVEDGAELRKTDTSTVKKTTGPVPNFYKKPNGVFFLAAESAGILPTDVFLKRRREVRFATQSGPILVSRNRVNPIFISGSADHTRRSGVGICGGDTIRFAISDDRVNFHDFARLFRDHLKCPDALFLDGGNGAGLYDPATNRNDWSWHGGYGPIVGLVE